MSLTKSEGENLDLSEEELGKANAFFDNPEKLFESEGIEPLGLLNNHAIINNDEMVPDLPLVA